MVEKKGSVKLEQLAGTDANWQRKMIAATGKSYRQQNRKKKKNRIIDSNHGPKIKQSDDLLLDFAITQSRKEKKNTKTDRKKQWIREQTSIKGSFVLEGIPPPSAAA